MAGLTVKIKGDASQFDKTMSSVKGTINSIKSPLGAITKAGAAIGASTATCTINASTFQATPSAGTYLSGASMASGDYGWFSKASV